MRRFPVTIVAALAALAPAHAQSVRIAPYAIVNGQEIPESLTTRAGDAESGRQLYFDRDKTGCSGCHGSPGGPGAQPDATAVQAPALSGVADRLSEGEIRLWLVAPEVLNPDHAMPAYYRPGQRDDPSDPRFGEPLLTASEIEDLVAYLARQTSE